MTARLPLCEISATGPGSSGATESPHIGARDPTATRHGIVQVPIEQVVVWNPDTVITWDRNFYRSVWQDFYWQWKALNGSDKEFQIAASNGYAEIAKVERGRDDREVIVTVRKQGDAFVGERDSLITKCPSKFQNQQKAS